MWLTKAVDTSVSLLVHVVVYTVPSLRRPPVLLVQRTLYIRGDHTPCSELRGCIGDAVDSLKTIHSILVAESMGGGFITGNRRLINVLQVINRQWYIMSARSEVDVMNLSAPPI